MGLEDFVAACKAQGWEQVAVATASLVALICERDALKADVDAQNGVIERLQAENKALKAEVETLNGFNRTLNEALTRRMGMIEALRAQNAAPEAKIAPSGHSCSDRAIVNDRLDALERDVKALQSRDILADQRMDHLDRRIDDLDQLGRRVLALEEALEPSK